MPAIETRKVLEEDEVLQSIKNYRLKNQTTPIRSFLPAKIAHPTLS